jgi:hypothetical protein
MDRERIEAIHPGPLSALEKGEQRRVAHAAICEVLAQLQANGDPDEWELYQLGTAMALFEYRRFYIAAFNACSLAAVAPAERVTEHDKKELPTLDQLAEAWRKIPPGAV